jgi:hypothetical protein
MFCETCSTNLVGGGLYSALLRVNSSFLIRCSFVIVVTGSTAFLLFHPLTFDGGARGGAVG